MLLVVNKPKGWNDYSLAEKIQETLKCGPTEVVGAFKAKQVRVGCQKTPADAAKQWILADTVESFWFRID